MIKFHRRNRMNYWSQSKVVGYLDRNGIRQQTKKTSYTPDEVLERFRMKDGFFESLVDKLQNLVMFPLDVVYSVRVHFKNKKGKTHVLSADLDEGSWYDLTYRIPVCLFTELEKFVEQEKGLEMHEWEKTLTHNNEWEKDNPYYGQLTPQALNAIEQEVIYKWWKENKNREYSTWEEEQKYETEEQEMLIRLVKIYRSLWT